MDKDKGLWYYVASAMKSLYLYIAGIVSVIVVGFILLNLQQGKDIVIQLGEYSGPFWFSLLCVLLWVFLNWYAARIIGYAKQCAGSDIPVFFYKHIPRLIAINGLVILQAAIFSLRTLSSSLEENHSGSFFYLKGVWVFLFIGLHNVLYWLLISMWTDKKNSKKTTYYILSISLSVIYIGWILYTYYAHRFCTVWQRHVKILPWFALLLFGVEWLAIRFFVLRRRKIDQMAGGASIGKPGSLQLLSMDNKFKDGEQKTWRVFGFISAAAILLFVWTLASIVRSDRMGPLAVLLLSLGVLVYFINVISYFSIRVRFNLHAILWIWAIILGLFSDPYKVETMCTTHNYPVFSNRLSVKEHFKRWMLLRRDSLENAKPNSFQVYIVLSNGGGSLSGNWTASILSKLQDRSREEDSANAFGRHLLCIAGASGGTIGNTVFYSLLQEQYQNRYLKDSGLYHHAYHFFYTDFLSYTLAHMLGTDLYRHIFPFKMGVDRARALELSMTASSHDTLIGRLLDRTLDKLYDHSGLMPAFFINTTRVDNGMPGELSSVLLPDSSQRRDVNSLLDTIGPDHKSGRLTLRLVTAGVLSSRFPYVAPAGRIKDEYFVDGGYFDNSGAGIVLEYLQALDDIMKDSTDPIIARYASKLHFNVLQIANGLNLESKEVSRIHPLTNDLVSPILTLIGMQGSSTKIGDGLLRAYLRRLNGGKSDAYIKFNLFYEDETEDTFPMSWVMSDYNLERMAQRVDSLMRKNYNRIKLK